MRYVCPDCGYESSGLGSCPECEIPMLKRDGEVDTDADSADDNGLDDLDLEDDNDDAEEW